MSNNLPLSIIIVEKIGHLKLLTIKDFKIEDLFKKCGFKSAEGFVQQTQWNVKMDGIKYNVQVYAKTDGRANNENKYDFPPPIDNKLFFGNCAIVAKKQDVKDQSKFNYCDLNIPLWDKIYEKLFGGFEDLASTAIEDENEVDELENIPKEKKTKHGYLKDGFVVDSSDTEDEEFENDDDDEEDDEEEETEEDTEENEDGELVEDIGSELSVDNYDYSTCEENEEN